MTNILRSNLDCNSFEERTCPDALEKRKKDMLLDLHVHLLE
jgi:hypothetical protein